jgi:peptidoglycan/xylan/chitin deacetylase (PgdA/CDA1 family)
MTPGFMTGEDFFAYLKESFEFLYREGETIPCMMSVGLHCRLSGRPARAGTLARLIDFVAGHDRVWISRRVDIARHWYAHHPPSTPRI